MKILVYELPDLLCSLVKNGECKVLIEKLDFEGLRNSAYVKVNFYHYDGMWGRPSRL